MPHDLREGEKDDEEEFILPHLKRGEKCVKVSSPHCATPVLLSTPRQTLSIQTDPLLLLPTPASKLQTPSLAQLQSRLPALTFPVAVRNKYSVSEKERRGSESRPHFFRTPFLTNSGRRNSLLLAPAPFSTPHN